VLPGARRRPDPARYEYAQHVPVGEQRNVAIDRAGPGYHTVHPRTHLLGRLPVRTSIPEDQPARCRLVDLLRRQTLVFAVIPLDQDGVDNDRVTKTD
jgi:hypothetical protein